MNINRTKIIFFLLLGLHLPFLSVSQKIIGLETKWSDSFKEWTIYTENEELEGSLEMLWKLDNDWTEWTFELGDFTGKIKQRYNNPGFWEFRSGNELVIAQTVWSGDLSEWRITKGKYQVKLKSKYYDIPSVWFSKGDDYGYIDIYMEYEDDPTNWIVEDHFNKEISPLFKLATIFIAIYQSTPKQ